MSRLTELVQKRDAILALEPEELAMLVLKDIAALESHRMSARPHRRTFSQKFQNEPEDVQRAIMEAWSWLEQSGCIAQCPCVDDGWFFVTRRGHKLLQTKDSAVFACGQILPRQLLHPRIEQKVWSAFIRGEYDSAVFEAVKQVEVAIRDAGEYDDADIGVKLARKAFHPDTGKLTNSEVITAERQALADLFAGVLGSYKNPHSHRNVAINDPTEAAEILILASHLLKIVDARKP